MTEKEKALQLYTMNNQMHYSENTLKTYIRYINQFLAFCPKELNEITKRDIKNWIGEALSTGAKPRTQHVLIAAVRSFFAE
ncbi:phage integrase N-terminal SAM-like domain-containing protein, partial [Dethiobacter alkaliphilus]|uniref:phage integrase N-terminal SAM-like domain-containing protein n=1 Tax=Dethiobacter alkaliphilus TaxID=427926 RepID=UPI002227E9C3